MFSCLGAVGPVRSQGNCASCYALVAAQAIETTQFLKVNEISNLVSLVIKTAKHSWIV